jgi:curved DNA-binding protein CbpA
MRKYHPDANGGVYCDARAKHINEAYATLSNPGLRAAYDAQRRTEDSPSQSETVSRGETAAGPTDGFAWTKPVQEPVRKMANIAWGLTALVTIGLAAAGFATGRFLSSTPTHSGGTAAETMTSSSAPSSSASDLASAAANRRTGAPGRAKAAARTVAAIVSDDIVPRWRPDCSASAGQVAVDVQVNLAPDGSLKGLRLAGGAGDPSQVAVAAESAKRAILQAAPFALPRESYDQWRVFIVRFDTKDVCG